MTKRESAIVSAYTGYLCGNFADLQLYVDEKFGRPTWTHEYGNKEFVDKLKKMAKEDFINLKIEEKSNG